VSEYQLHLDADARHRNGTAQAAIEDAGRHTEEDVGQVVNSSRDPWRGQALKAVVAVVLAVWLAVVVLLGAGGAFISPLGTPPYPIALGVTVPLLVFLGALWVSAAFRRFVTGGDVLLVTAIQGWRWAGFSFVGLYAYGVLPGLFAWPAGLGDMAVGLTAPWIALALVRRPGFAASRGFVIWNLLGILDLVAAVGIAALLATQATGAVREASVTQMARLPLLLVPAYLVPVFIMLHLSALLQARRLARTTRGKEAGPNTSLRA
jgi:hypothetical protein